MGAIYETLLGNAAATALLVPFVYGVCKVVPSASLKHALWLIVLVRLWLPPVWQIAPTAEVQAVSESTLARPVGPPPAEPIAASEAEFFWPATQLTEPESQAVTSVTPPAEQFDWTAVTLTVLPLTALCGTFVILTLAIVRVYRMRRLLLTATPAPNSIRDQVTELAPSMGVRRIPRVLLLPGRVPPMVCRFGWLGSGNYLLLPVELAFRLRTAELATVLAHELAHLKRGDHLVRWFEMLTVAMFWWFPLLGWVRSQLRANEEEACDRSVLALMGDGRNYASALLETALFLDGSAPRMPLLASGVAPIRPLQRRISMILQGSRADRLTRLGFLAVFGIAAAALAVGPALSARDPEEKDPPRKEKGAPPRDGEKRRPAVEGKDPPPRERPDVPLKEGVSRDEFEKARKDLDDARNQLEKAMRNVREAEERLMKLSGRGDFRPADGRFPPMGRPAEGRFPPDGPRPDGVRPEGGDRLGELEKQLRRLSEELQMMRREMRRPEGRPDADPNRLEGNPRRPEEKRDFRPERRDDPPPPPKDAPRPKREEEKRP